MNVSENLQKIQSEIHLACEQAGRHAEDVKIIAVTKYVSIERAREAFESGVIHLGENRDEGLLLKQEAIGEEPIWHFIGSLQTRKVKNIIERVDYLHSLDRESLAIEINKRAQKKIKCLVQVNVSGEHSKHGLNPEEVSPFVQKLAQYENIEVVGLMTMAPFTEDEAILRRCFQTLKELQQAIQTQQYIHAPCNELSMGMSNDYRIAVEEGATMVRIGTALVGES